jgi:hypothetical protein
MASTNVSKLKFMAKAREPPSSGHANHTLSSDSAEKWSIASVDPSKVHTSKEENSKLSSINTMARRSYGGANPYIEQQMASLEKSKRQKKN